MMARICVIAHAGTNGGHCGQNVTTQRVMEYFHWHNIRKDVTRLCSGCIHCLPIRGGNRIPRPLGTQLHGDHRNHVVHWDVLHIAGEKHFDRNSYHDYTSIMVGYDDFDGTITLTACGDPNSMVMADCIMEWRAVYGTPEIIVSDRASYFKSEVVKNLNKRLGVDHHFVVSYSHYPNGTIETVIRFYFLY